MRRIPRIYHPAPINIGATIHLNSSITRHLSCVLRMSIGQSIQLFDGSNQVFNAKISHLDKKNIRVTILNVKTENRESPLHIHLGQVILSSEKMAFTIQKSIELGVSLITPLFSERCNVKLNAKRLNKKIQQWQRIAIVACEQCGRNIIPKICPAIDLKSWCTENDRSIKLNLCTYATTSINRLTLPIKKIRLLIGSEGGLSTNEITMITKYAFTNILLGPRILRTETTALTAITALQVLFGDLQT